jgi:hypothetical protein
VGYTDDENDLVYARSDMELSEAYRLFRNSNEIKLSIHESTDPLTNSGYNPDHYSPPSFPRQPTISSYSDSPVSIKDDIGLIFDDSLFQLSLKNINQAMTDLSKAKENLINLNETNRNKQTESEKLISAEREKFEKLESELKQAQENFSSVSFELSNLKESVKKVGTQLQLKLKEIYELKRDKDEKLRLKAQLDELDQQLNGKIEENLTMSKHLYTLTIERDHFTKKAKDLEHKQKTMEAELTASLAQFTHNLPSPVPPITHENPSIPMNPVIINGGIPVSGIVHQPVLVHSNTPIHSNNSIHSNAPIHSNNPHSNTPFYSNNPIHSNNPIRDPPNSNLIDDDIDMEDIRMIYSMGFNWVPVEKIKAYIRTYKKDISRVIEELLKDVNENKV